MACEFVEILQERLSKDESLSEKGMGLTFKSFKTNLGDIFARSSSRIHLVSS